MLWAYGVTTVPQRRTTLLPRTLDSLAAAGFDAPRLFVDGAESADYVQFGLPVTSRVPAIRTFANFMLGLAELYCRCTTADRYAMFQDDLICVAGLREYLSKVAYPPMSYMNLYTFPQNQAMAKGRRGFYPSNQLGKGALALVFNRDAVRMIIQSRYVVDRMLDRIGGWKSIDGGIVCAFKSLGWKEYVHNPSLVQHTGRVSTMGNRRHPLAGSFPGEGFDATELLPDDVPSREGLAK